MKSNTDLTVDEFYLSKNLKRTIGDVISAKQGIDDCLYRAKKINHPNLLTLQGCLMEVETVQRELISILSNLHKEN